MYQSDTLPFWIVIQIGRVLLQGDFLMRKAMCSQEQNPFKSNKTLRKSTSAYDVLGDPFVLVHFESRFFVKSANTNKTIARIEIEPSVIDLWA